MLGQIDPAPWHLNCSISSRAGSAIGWDRAPPCQPDTVQVVIARDDAPRTVELPADLAAALVAEPRLREAFVNRPVPGTCLEVVP